MIGLIKITILYISVGFEINLQSISVGFEYAATRLVFLIASIWVNLTAQKLLVGAIQIKNVLGLS